MKVSVKSGALAVALALSALGSATAVASQISPAVVATDNAATQVVTLDFSKQVHPNVLKSLSQTGPGLEIVEHFEAKGGLDGWVLKDGESGQYFIGYTTPDGEVLLAGLALNAQGENLSALYNEQYVPAPDYSAAMSDFAEVADSVVLGNAHAPAEIVVAYDPNCGFCKVLHKLVQPAIDAGQLKMRVVPVAILGQDSGPKSAGLLATSDLHNAMVASTYGIGQVQRSNDPALLSKVNANTNLMRKHGFNGTPLVLYEADRAGNPTVYVSNGVPAVKEMFERLGIDGNLDKIDDPSLARFLN